MQIRKSMISLTFQKQSLRGLFESSGLVKNNELIERAFGTIYFASEIEAQNISTPLSMVSRDTVFVKSVVSDILVVTLSVNCEEVRVLVMVHQRRGSVVVGVMGTFMMRLVPITAMRTR
jgi:hypothetical protein